MAEWLCRDKCGHRRLAVGVPVRVGQPELFGVVSELSVIEWMIRTLFGVAFARAVPCLNAACVCRRRPWSRCRGEEREKDSRVPGLQSVA